MKRFFLAPSVSKHLSNGGLPIKNQQGSEAHLAVKRDLGLHGLT